MRNSLMMFDFHSPKHKILALLLQFKHISDRLKCVNNSRYLSVWHQAIICNKYIFVSLRGAMWKFSHQIGLNCFLFSNCNDYATEDFVGFVWFVILIIGVILQWLYWCDWFCCNLKYSVVVAWSVPWLLIVIVDKWRCRQTEASQVGVELAEVVAGFVALVVLNMWSSMLLYISGVCLVLQFIWCLIVWSFCMMWV